MDTKRLIILAKLLGWEVLSGGDGIKTIININNRLEWADWLLTGNGMMAVMERMGGLGLQPCLIQSLDGKQWQLTYRRKSGYPDVGYLGSGPWQDTAPEAVAEAAYAALGGERE